MNIWSSLCRPFKSIYFLVTFLLVLPTISLAGQFKVTRVYDGDTVKAVGHDIEIKVRLIGIDAETARPVPEGAVPCRLCKRVIINAGIAKVVTRNDNGRIVAFNVSEWINAEKFDYHNYAD